MRHTLTPKGQQKENRTSLPAPYSALISFFLKKAEDDQNIRGIFAFGSRGRHTEPAPDRYSDLDLAIVCTDSTQLTDDPQWVKELGDLWFYHKQPISIGSGIQVRLMFNQALDADCVFLEQKKFMELQHTPLFSKEYIGRGIAVYLDKDGTIGAAQTNQSIPKMGPTQQSYDTLVHDFLYHAVYATKKICRGELLTAKNTIDVNFRDHFTQAARWQTELKSPQEDTYHRARHFETWASDRHKIDLKIISPIYEDISVRHSLMNTLVIMDGMTSDIAHRSHLTKDQPTFSKVMAWIQGELHV